MSCLTDPSAIGPGPSFASQPSLAGSPLAGAARPPLQPGRQLGEELTAMSCLTKPGRPLHPRRRKSRRTDHGRDRPLTSSPPACGRSTRSSPGATAGRWPSVSRKPDRMPLPGGWRSRTSRPTASSRFRVKRPRGWSAPPFPRPALAVGKSASIETLGPGPRLPPAAGTFSSSAPRAGGGRGGAGPPAPGTGGLRKCRNRGGRPHPRPQRAAPGGTGRPGAAVQGLRARLRPAALPRRRHPPEQRREDETADRPRRRRRPALVLPDRRQVPRRLPLGHADAGGGRSSR